MELLFCLFAGALGGALYHLFWLVKIGHESVDIPSDAVRDVKFRLSLLLLSVGAGAAMAFLVWLWFSGETSIKTNHLAVIAAIAGLASDASLGVLRRIAGM